MHACVLDYSNTMNTTGVLSDQDSSVTSIEDTEAERQGTNARTGDGIRGSVFRTYGC